MSNDNGSKDNNDNDDNDENDDETVAVEPISASHPGSCGFIKVQEVGNMLNL